MENEILELTKICLRGRYKRLRDIICELENWSGHTTTEEEFISHITTDLENYSEYIGVGLWED